MTRTGPPSTSGCARSAPSSTSTGTAVIVGEVYLLDLRRLVEYINTGDELHLAHNFVFFHLPWQAAAFRASVQEFTELAEQSAWPAWFLENHDHSRVATALRGRTGKRAASREDGRHADLHAAGHAFPVLRSRNSGCRTRTSRQTGSWTSTAGIRNGRRCHGGGHPWLARAPASPPRSRWLPVVTGAESLCVESQQQDPGSTLAFVRRLTHLRSREPALQSGTLRLSDAAADVFCYERELDRRFLIALNFSSDRVPLALGEDAPGPAFLELSTHSGREHGAVDLQDLVLEPDEGLILRLSEGGAGPVSPPVTVVKGSRPASTRGEG